MSEFHQDKSRKDGHKYVCKVCVNKSTLQYYYDHREEGIKKRREYYYETWEQQKEYRKKYNAENKEVVRARNEKWKENNKQKWLDYHREYDKKRYWGNRDEELECHRRYREENPEKAREAQKRWRDKDPEKAKRIYREIARRRRAREVGAEGSFTDAEWHTLCKRHDYTCLCCGRKEPEVKLAADHVVPLSRGGTDYIDNIQPLCQSCNSRKRTKSTDYRRTAK